MNKITYQFLTGSASLIMKKRNGCTTRPWSGSSFKSPTEYVSSRLGLILVTDCSCAAIINLSQPHGLLTVCTSLHSEPPLNPSTHSHSATFDSGPGGDSFLAPRLLPKPDEGGDYRWPSECMSHSNHTAGKNFTLINNKQFSTPSESTP